MNAPCLECGCNPCLGICPTQDRYAGNQEEENRDYEANAGSDYLSEAYGATARDAERFSEDEHDYRVAQWEEQQADPMRAVCVLDYLPNCAAASEDDDIPF